MQRINDLILRLPEHLLFLFIAVPFGFIILFLTPPFQVPDEINHFYRAYQISDGGFLPVRENNRIGGYIPLSFEKFTHHFAVIRWNQNVKTKRKTILEQFNASLNDTNRKFVDFPNTALYSFVSYLPQSFIIYLIRKTDAAPALLFYAARIITFLFWVFCICYAIRLTPVYKLLFCFLALLPMSLYQNMSLSADVMTNILSFLFIAMVLRYSFSDSPLTKLRITKLFLAAGLLSLAKFAYMPVIISFLCIPYNKSGNKKKFIALFAAMIVLCCGLVFLWSGIIEKYYIPYNRYNSDFKDDILELSLADIPAQVKFIMNNKLHIFTVMFNSVFQQADTIIPRYIGMLGWLDTKLPIWIICVSYLMIFTLSLTGNSSETSIVWRHKTVFLLCFAAGVIMVILSQYLLWTPVGHDISNNVQGRYFIPVFPFLFMTLYNRKFVFPGIRVLKKLVLLVSFFILTGMLYTIYARYYMENNFRETVYRCNAESVSDDGQNFLSTGGVYLENGITRTDEISRSGKFSAKIGGQKPYGFTFRLRQCKKDDIIEAEVWKYGIKGGIAVSSGNGFYFAEKIPVMTDAKGWKKVFLSFTIPAELAGKEIALFVYNPDNEMSFFDDITIYYKEPEE